MIDPSTWIALAALAVSLVLGVLNANHQSNGDVKAQIDDARAEASRQARIETSLTAIQSDTSDIKSEMRSMKNDVQDMSKRLVIVEQSTRSAHHRIDEIVKRRNLSNDQLENPIEE